MRGSRPLRTAAPHGRRAECSSAFRAKCPAISPIRSPRSRVRRRVGLGLRPSSDARGPAREHDREPSGFCSVPQGGVRLQPRLHRWRAAARATITHVAISRQRSIGGRDGGRAVELGGCHGPTREVRVVTCLHGACHVPLEPDALGRSFRGKHGLNRARAEPPGCRATASEPGSSTCR